MTATRRPVYIVDDDEAVRDSIRLLLESSGFAAQEFASADLFLKSETADMGCLLLDLHMPGISGLELLRLLRSRGIRRPVIVVSGRRDPVQDAEVWPRALRLCFPSPLTTSNCWIWSPRRSDPEAIR